MRQRRDLNRNVERREFLVNVISPTTGSTKTIAKPILETVLKSYATHRITQCLVTDVQRPKSQNARLFSRQIVSLAAGKRAQYDLQRFAPLIDASLPLAPRSLLGHSDAFVNDTEMTIVVQHAFVVIVFGEDVDPEVDIGLQLFGLRKYFICRRCAAKK